MKCHQPSPLEYSEVSSLIILSAQKNETYFPCILWVFPANIFKEVLAANIFGLSLLMWKVGVVLPQLFTKVCFSDHF